MKSKQAPHTVSRRHFLATTALAFSAPMIIPSSALGLGGKVAPSNRITMGVVGWGMQGPGNTRSFMELNDCRVVATCDIDKNHLKAATDRKSVV